MTELTFIEEGNQNNVGEYINFKKRLTLARVLEQIKSFQAVEYPIEPKEPLFTYLNQLSYLDDESLYQLSLSREPRDCEINDLV